MNISANGDSFEIAPKGEAFLSIFDKALFHLPHGGFLSIWLQHNPAAEEGPSFLIGLRQFGADMTPTATEPATIGIDGEYWVPPVPMTFHMLDDGTIMAIWTQEHRGGFVNYSDIQALRFGQDGRVISEQMAIFEGDPRGNIMYSGHSAIVLEDGNLFVTAGKSNIGNEGGESLYGRETRIVSPDGTQLLNLGFDEGSGVDGYKFTPLEDGGFARLGHGRNELEVQFFDPEGNPTPAPVVTPVGRFTYDIQIVTLTNGNVVIAWNEENHTGSDVMARVFDPTGEALADAFLVNTTVWDFQDSTRLVALPDGRFVVAWFDLGGLSLEFSEFDPEPAIRAQVFEPDGTPAGPEQILLEWPEPEVHGGDNGPYLDDLAALSDGTLIVRLQQTDGSDDAQHFSVAPRPVPTEGPDDLYGLSGDDVIDALAGDDRVAGHGGDDRLIGGDGDDTLEGGDGADTLNGGDGDDLIRGGATEADRRDVIYAGSGNDSVDGGYGNDLIFGQGGNDTIAGGFGADELQGQDGDDVITGSAFGDIVFGNAGNDFVNGGFGHDLINGGAGADKFFHVGVEGHGSDWVQDYSAAEGDVLVFGGAGTADQFQVNLTHTANKTTGERSGDDSVEEAFVIYKPTGQILWALVDGGGQASINLQIGAEVFDLLA